MINNVVFKQPITAPNHSYISNWRFNGIKNAATNINVANKLFIPSDKFFKNNIDNSAFDAATILSNVGKIVGINIYDAAAVIIKNT